MDRASITGFVERSVDHEREFSFREFLIKFYIRKWTLLLCVLIALVPTLGLSLLTPTTWVAQTEILVRYSTTESVFLKDLIPDDRATLSGSVIGEILRSMPTLTETVRRYDIQETDLYQEPMKVLTGKLSSAFPFGDRSPPDPDRRIDALAKTLQASLEESSKSSATGARARPVQILGRDSPIPQSQKADELITISVRSFNRLKVAEITNGLAQVLMDRYYQISAEDAHRAYDFLSKLLESAEAQVRQLESDPGSDIAPSLPDAALGGRAGAPADSSQVARLTNDLAALQSELGRLQQFYMPDSPRMARIQAEIANLKQLLQGQERVERAKSVLREIRARRFQALNTENLYRDRLVPISIIERAVTPPPAPAAVLARHTISALVGIAIGLVFGGALVTIFGALDDRLYTPADAERTVGVPVFGSLPKLGARWRKLSTLPESDGGTSSPSVGPTKILNLLDAGRLDRHGHVVAIASTNDDDGKSLVSLLLARATVRSAPSRVLLVDADLLGGSLSRSFQQSLSGDLANSLGDTGRPLSELIVRHHASGLDILPAGVIAECRKGGFFLGRLKQLLEAARASYDLIIVDTPSFSTGGELIVCCMAADSVLIVVKSGTTRRNEVKSLLRSLDEVAVRPRGTILNFRNSVVPRFLDQGA